MGTYFALALLATTLTLTAAQARTSSGGWAEFRQFADERSYLIQKDRRVRERRCLEPRRVYHRNHWFRGRPGLYAAATKNWRRKLRHDMARGSRCLPRTVPGIIRHVFGVYGDQAVRVAYCESRFSTSAVNGQYLGLFQMGSWERATYGHGADALSQSRAAHRYFVASGSDWSPWACAP